MGSRSQQVVLISSSFLLFAIQSSANYTTEHYYTAGASSSNLTTLHWTPVNTTLNHTARANFHRSVVNSTAIRTKLKDDLEKHSVPVINDRPSLSKVHRTKSKSKVQCYLCSDKPAWGVPPCSNMSSYGDLVPLPPNSRCTKTVGDGKVVRAPLTNEELSYYLDIRDNRCHTDPKGRYVICACSTDKCNGVESLKSSFTMFLMVSSVLLLLKPSV